MQTNLQWQQIDDCLGVKSGKDQGGEEVRDSEETLRKKLLGVMDMQITLIAEMASLVYTYIKTYQIVHFKYMQFIICQLYLNKVNWKIEFVLRHRREHKY